MSVSTARKLPPTLRFVSIGFLILWLVVAAFPFLWTVWGSFKVQADFFSRDSFWHAIWGTNTIAQTGSSFTGAGYYGAWITNDFWRAVGNTAVVTVCVTVISLTFGTLGGYALARSGYRYSFWLLMLALVFRAMPHITLVSGYLLPSSSSTSGGTSPHRSSCWSRSTSPSRCGCCTPSSCQSRAISTRARWSTAARASRPSAASSSP